jgi:purine-binding chemotaxis protein CheW
MAASYLTFHLGSETYAVQLARVSEIVAYPERIARVPTAPVWLRGLFNLRGAVLPALDLCSRLGYATSQPTGRTCLLITQVEVERLSFSVAMIVDSVHDLLELTPEQIEPAPAFGSGLRVECLLGTVRKDGDVLCVLDLTRLFAQDELLELALQEERARAQLMAAPAPQPEPKRNEPAPATAPDLGRPDPDIPGLYVFEDA